MASESMTMAMIMTVMIPANTQTVLIVRHGSAGRKARYKGVDRERPLDATGRSQAESLVPQLLAFGVSDVYAADRVRCAQTVEPLAREMDVQISLEPTLTEEAYGSDPKSARRRVIEIAARGGTPVICTDACGAAAIVTDEQSGCVVPSGQVAPLAAALTAALAQGTVLPQTRIAVNARAAANASPEQAVHRFFDGRGTVRATSVSG